MIYRILAIGDVVGEQGLAHLERSLRPLKRLKDIHFTVVNGENAAITATILQLACVDAGLASCWVHVDGRPRRREEPAGEQALDYLRTLLPLPEGCGVLCVVAAGYSDFEPAPLPAFDPRSRILSLDDDPHAAE